MLYLYNVSSLNFLYSFSKSNPNFILDNNESGSDFEEPSTLQPPLKKARQSNH